MCVKLHLVQNSLVDAPALGLRERKKRARREALIDATHRLVAEHGLDAVTVEAICEEAGVSARTFFNYFETKDDAVLGHTPWPLDSAAAEDVRVRRPDRAPARRPPGTRQRVPQRPADGPATPRPGASSWPPRSRACSPATSRGWSSTRASSPRWWSGGWRTAPTPPYSSEIVGATLLFLTHATFLRWDAAGGTGSADEHLAAVVTELRSILTD